MEIIYIITVLWLLVSAMLIKKSDKEQNVLLSVTLSIILFTAYNILLSFIFLIFNITYNLLALSIVNIILSGITTFEIYKKKSSLCYRTGRS